MSSTELIWERLISYEDQMEFLHLDDQEVRALHTLGLVDKETYEMDAWLAAISRFKFTSSGYRFDSFEFLSLKRYFKPARIRPYFKPLAIKSGLYDRKWLEELYDHVIKYLAYVDENDWEEVKIELVEMGCIKPDGVHVNKMFKYYFYEILIKRPSTLRQFELKLHFTLSELKAYFAKHFTALQNVFRSKFVQNSKFISSQEGLQKLTQAGPHQHPNVDDDDLLDFIDEMEDLGNKGNFKVFDDD